MLISLTPVTTQATDGFNSVEECIESCQEALDKADIYINGLETALKLQRDYTDTLEKQTVELSLSLDKAEEEADSSKKQLWIWGAVGVAVGALTMGLVK